jgi:Fe-S cluster assembly protein SufB
MRRPHRPLYRGQEPLAQIEHEATTSKISDDQMFYAQQRGLNAEDAVAPDRQRLRQGSAAAAPDGIRVEAQKLLGISLEGSVG